MASGGEGTETVIDAILPKIDGHQKRPSDSPDDRGINTVEVNTNVAQEKKA